MAVLFTVARELNQPRYPSTDKQQKCNVKAQLSFIQLTEIGNHEVFMKINVSGKLHNKQSKHV